VYEDEFVVGFWDAHPARPIHILIVPRDHIATLNDIPEDDHILARIGQAASKIAADFGVADSGYRLAINVNREGGQVIFHLHAHLMAGRKGASI
jgi:histidine triad (HIT) family protein